MMGIREKKDLIVQYEELQAQLLAGRVIFKPPLTAWYILMPLIFIYYFYRLQKYAQSRKEFVYNYMRSRRRALEEVADAIEDHRKPDIEGFREFTTVPAEAMDAYIAWIRVLADHYADLLRGDGSCCEDLIRSAYNGRGNYLLFLNRLNRIEHKLNRALTPGLEVDIPDVTETITLIETQVEQMRRAEAERIFPRFKSVLNDRLVTDSDHRIWQGIQPSDRRWAMAGHLLPLGLFLGLPGLHILAPFLIWRRQCARAQFSANHALEAFNFQ